MNQQLIGSKPKTVGPILASYVGPSMNPTLRAPEILEIVPYGSRPIRVGDVVAFRSPQRHRTVVHRIVRLAPEGIFTRGDNNNWEDAFVLQPEDIKGRVVAARRGRNCRAVAGGRRGRLISRVIPWKRLLDRNLSYMLHIPYNTLSHRRFLTAFLPARLRPKIVVFRDRGIERPCILLGRRIIGRLDDHQQQWQIDRPFRIMVDVSRLPPAPFKMGNNAGNTK